MRHKSNNKTRPLFTLSLEMTRLVNETRLLLVPCFNSDIYGISLSRVTRIMLEHVSGGASEREELGGKKEGIKRKKERRIKGRRKKSSFTRNRTQDLSRCRSKL